MLNEIIEGRSRPICTNFERSGYEVLKLFNTETPVSEDEAYQALSGVRILLGAQVTIADYLQSLCCGNELVSKDDGYIITPRGIKERERLKVLVDHAGLVS